MKVIILLLATSGLSVLGSLNSPKIVDLNTEPNGTPWIVSIQSRYLLLLWQHRCTGSILNQEWIIVAADCIDGESKSDLSIYAGTNNWKVNGIRRYVDILVTHPDYEKATNTANIGLIKMTQSLVYSTSVQPISINEEVVPTGALVTLYGWRLIQLNGLYSDSVEKVDMETISSADCKAKQPDQVLVGSNTCAVVKLGENVCQQDSGGPVLWQDPQSYNLVLTGVIIGGIGCATSRTYTNLSYSTEWINQTIN